MCAEASDQGDQPLVLVVDPPGDVDVEAIHESVDGISVTDAGVDRVRSLLENGRVGGLVTFPDDDGNPDLGAGVNSPVVACVPDDESASRRLEAGVTEVYVTTDGVCPSVLARRIRSALRSSTPGSDGTTPTGDGESLHERRLRRLVAATRELMGADSTDEVARAASEAATEITDIPGTGYRRYEPEDGVLESVAIGGNVTGIDSRPTYSVGDSPHGEAFLSGETVVDDIDDDEYDRDPFSQTMYVPVGDYGVLSLGLVEGTFDEGDRRFAELLAASTEAALDRARRRERLLRYQGVVERAAGMVFALDEDDCFTLVSPALADRLGYERSALRGEPFGRIIDDAAIAADSDGGGLLSGEADESFETRLLTADGERVPVQLEASPLFGSDDDFRGAVGTARDISELAEAREKLSDERDRFTYLFENLPDAVAEIDAFDGDAVIRSANEDFVETFGPAPDGVVGHSLDEFVLSPEFRKEGTRLNERAAEGDTLETYVRRQSVDGTRHFLLRAVPYEVAGGRTRSFVIYTDVTEQKQRERYIRVVNRVLRHNLRNDLNLVGGYAERLCNRVDDDRLADHAARIRDTVGRMVSQSEAAREVQEAIRQERDHSERVDLVERVRAVVTEYRERYPDAGIETDLPETSHVAAGRRLDLVVRNLVENALVHNDGTEPTIAVRVERAPDRVCLTVEDDGPGIPDSERAVVAEDREITQLEHGSGLGLWVVKWLVENYGGGVEFVETDLGGAAVRVSFHRDPTG